MILAIIIILYSGIILVDYIPVIKNRDKKIIWVYSIFLIFSFITLILYSFKMPIPSFYKIIMNII